MPFHEKSAWILSFALLLGGAVYFSVVALMSAELGQLAPPLLPLVVVYILVMVVIAIIGHIVIGTLAPKDANASLDERERRIFDRAGHLAGYVFASGVVLALGAYLFSYDGNLLFHGVFGSLMLGQLTEYLVQIRLYRATV